MAEPPLGTRPLVIGAHQQMGSSYGSASPMATIQERRDPQGLDAGMDYSFGSPSYMGGYASSSRGLAPSAGMGMGDHAGMAPARGDGMYAGMAPSMGDHVGHGGMYAGMAPSMGDHGGIYAGMAPPLSSHFGGSTRREPTAQEKADRLNYYASLPSTAPAQMQKVFVMNSWRDIRPSECGVTLAQCRDVLLRAKHDPDQPWKPYYTVGDLVELYIKRWTAETGTCYALQVNGESPIPVNVMVSHVWGGRAEDFFDALEGWVSHEDVMYISALSLYLCEDGYGPSVQQQFGKSLEESPLCCVLDSIMRTGEKLGRLNITWWQMREWLEFTPAVLSSIALLIFCLPITFEACVPTFTDCFDLQGSAWHMAPLRMGYEACLPLALFFILSALVGRLALTPRKVYNARLLVVPNPSCDVFGRLACLQEIFVAKTFRVPVIIASIIGSETCATTSSEMAVCNEAEDTMTLTHELSRIAQGDLVNVDKLIVGAVGAVETVMAGRALLAAFVCSQTLAAYVCLTMLNGPNMTAARFGFSMGVAVAEPYVMVVQSRVLVRASYPSPRAICCDLPTHTFVLGAACTLGIAAALEPAVSKSSRIASGILYFTCACNGAAAFRSLLSLLVSIVFRSDAWQVLRRVTSGAARRAWRVFSNVEHKLVEVAALVTLLAQMWDTGWTLPSFVVFVLPIACVYMQLHVLLLSARWSYLEQMVSTWSTQASRMPVCKDTGSLP